MNAPDDIFERWFTRTLVALCVAASLALVVLHQSGNGLRPTERGDDADPAPAATNP